MIEFVQGKRNIIMTLAILFVVVSLSGTTYSLFFNAETTNTINYDTGVLNLEVIEDKKITIENSFPTLDSEGMKQEPYKLTIKNTGTVPYVFDLKMLASTYENTVDTKYIKVMVDDNTPKTLYETSNLIASNVIVYPNEDRIFNIRVWLDNNTPNQELGKTFIAKIATNGESIYKTQDKSGANKPNLIDNMIPIYYDEKTSSWNKADKNNIVENATWYNYSEGMWANAVSIKDSKKQIYDVAGNNNIIINKIDHNNTNAVLGNNYLDLGIKNNKSKISSILRIKFDTIEDKQIYIISNSNSSYYYDTTENKFVLNVGNISSSSSKYIIEEKKWYIIGFTYDENKVSFYVNGTKISTVEMYTEMSKNSTFKLGTDNKEKIISNITVGDVYIYNKVLSDKEIELNYKTNINIIYNSLIAGYNNFVPMTNLEYYNNMPNGTKIRESDIISMYVWIPRFKYQLFNSTGKNIDLNETLTKGIGISFENGTESTGSIYCKDNLCYSDNLMITKLTDNDNGKYYTHPAFTTKDGEVTGFWISKYELSQDKNILYSKKGTESLTNLPLSDLYKLIKTIKSEYSYHMITNTEWGAVTYLTNSIYGICKNNSCKNMVPNNSLISGSELSDSTTNNNYGVFDMNGGYAEFVMANYADEFGNISLSNTQFNNVPISNNDYDLYKETFILGDATKELSEEKPKWTQTQMDSTNNWLVRGGIYIEENASIFSYRSSADAANEYITTRITIK